MRESSCAALVSEDQKQGSLGVAVVQQSSVIPCSKEKLFSFLFQEGAWERGIPSVLQPERLRDGSLREGSILKWRLHWTGFTANWAVQIERIKPGEMVQVNQKIGAFNSWQLTQALEDHGGGQTVLSDLIEYEMPLGLFGRLADDLLVRREMSRLLEVRHDQIRELVEAHVRKS
jgi:ligand-binding SRPBCC domain-containing protein